jgi:beta-ureidopropionase / N-carbamoyl-L-amino-acid hydrolase
MGVAGNPDDAVSRGFHGVVIGSHLDSILDGGAFDGPLGVVSAFLAVDLLRAGASSHAQLEYQALTRQDPRGEPQGI